MKNKELLQMKCVVNTLNRKIKLGDIITIAGVYKKNKRKKKQS